jgi:hypothetical protein
VVSVQVGSSVGEFFTSQPALGRPITAADSSRFSLRPPRSLASAPVPKKYFAATTLPELLLTYAPYEKTMATVGERQPPAVLTPEETAERECFLHFVSGLLQVCWCAVTAAARARVLWVRP